MRRSAPALAVLLALVFWAGAALTQTFPDLSGRVVDGAGILPPAAEQAIAKKLAAHEKATSNQVVVVTLKSLEGHDIADYGYRLGRHWGIGQKGRDNGVLLIVAPNERKVRIEVGYGLEGDLPDATAKLIVENDILPRFRDGDMAGGVSAGVDAILGAIEGTYEPLPSAKKKDIGPAIVEFVPLLGFGFIFVLAMLRTFRGEGRVGRRGPWGRRGGPIIMGGGHRHGSGGFGGGLGGGGFSGGGGGFGGGGASGGW